MSIVFSGFDSAWGGKEKGAICDLLSTIGKNGSVNLEIKLTKPVDWEGAIEHAKNNYSKFKNHVLAIDQGLIVPNKTGQRPVENKIASAFMRRYSFGAHTSNLENPCYCEEAGIWKFLKTLDNLNYKHDPISVPGMEGRAYFECYPHPAIIGLFNLDKRLDYKVKKKDPSAWEKLIECLHSLQSRKELPIVNIKEWVPCDFPQNKENENKLDSIISAYVAAYFWHFGTEKSSVVGTLKDGYMVTPVNKEMADLIEEKFDSNEINQGNPQLQSLGDVFEEDEQSQTEIEMETHLQEMADAVKFGFDLSNPSWSSLANECKNPQTAAFFRSLGDCSFSDFVESMLQAKTNETRITESLPVTDTSLNKPVMLIASDPGNLWGNVNSWMNQERCQDWLLYIRFLHIESQPEVIFGPFSNQGNKQFGMRPWDEESRKEWHRLAKGTKKSNQKTFPVRFRYISLIKPK